MSGMPPRSVMAERSRSSREAAWRARGRGIKAYERGLFDLPAVVDWQPRSLREALNQVARGRLTSDPLHVADLGCGAGVFLLELAYAFWQEGVPGVFTGCDRGINGEIYPPLDFLPDNDERLQEVLDRFSPERVTVAEIPFPLPTFHRTDLDGEDWCLPPASQDLIVSMTAIMYLADKLRFLSRVFDSLRPGGMAILHVDEMRPPFFPAGRLRRIYLPDDAPFPGLLSAWAAAGIDAALGTGKDRRHVLLLRRRAGERLPCDLVLARSEKETWENTVADKAWGCRSHYGRPGDVTPETAADRAARPNKDDAVAKAALALWSVHRPGGVPTP